MRRGAVLLALLLPATAEAAPVLGTLGSGPISDLCVGPGDTLCGLHTTGAVVCREPTGREWTSQPPEGHEPAEITCLRDGGVATLGWVGRDRVVDLWRADRSWRVVRRFGASETASGVAATEDGGFVITGWRGSGTTAAAFVDHHTADGDAASHARVGTNYPHASASFLGVRGEGAVVLTSHQTDTWTAVSVAPDGGLTPLLSTEPEPDWAPFGHPFYPDWAAVAGDSLVLAGVRPSAWGGVQAAIAEVVWVRGGSVVARTPAPVDPTARHPDSVLGAVQVGDTTVVCGTARGRLFGKVVPGRARDATGRYGWLAVLRPGAAPRVHVLLGADGAHASIPRVVALSDGRVVALLATEGPATLDGQSLGDFKGTRLWTFGL